MISRNITINIRRKPVDEIKVGDEIRIEINNAKGNVNHLFWFCMLPTLQAKEIC